VPKGQWLRAGSWLQCGAEEECRIEAGEPYLMIVFDNSVKYRCQKHAGRPVPAEVEAVRPVTTKPVPAFTGLGELAQRFDAKKAAAGKDE